MAWNEPGKQNGDKEKDKDRDPWTNKPKKSTEDSSSELEEAFKKMQQKMSRLFSSKDQGQGGTLKSNNPRQNFISVAIIVLAIALLWFFSGFFIVQPAQRAVVQFFGKYDKTVGPGVHWVPRFIATENIVDIQKIYTHNYPTNQDARVLTKDQNFASISVNVQYRITNPERFLFSVVDPIDTLNQAIASATQQVIGSYNFNDILTADRDQIRLSIKQQLGKILAIYNPGILVTDVTLKSVKAPGVVKTAFDDVIKAQEDADHQINQAQIYAMQVEPTTLGPIQKLLTDAKTYQQQVVLQAQASVASFLALLPEYKSASQVTRERLYLETLEQVFKRTSKILIDSQGGNNIVYLPLDKLMNNQASSTQSKPMPITTETQAMAPPVIKPPAALGNRPTRNQIDYGYGKGVPYE